MCIELCFDAAGFRSFTLEEQIETVQNFMFPIVLVILSTTYDVRNASFNWFNYTHNEFLIIMKQFDVFYGLVPWFHRMGNILHELNADETELSFLCGLCLLNGGELCAFACCTRSVFNSTQAL